ncbi:MAG: DMT family transporter, partial [Thermomicrobiales bacterium]
ERSIGATKEMRRAERQGHGTHMTGTAFLLLVIAIVLSTFGEVLLKAGVNQIGTITLAPGTLVRAFLQWQVLVGFVLLFGGSLFWLAVLSRVHLSIAYPLLAMGYILTTIWALVFLKEPVPASRWLGVGAICGGIVLVLYKS